MSEVGRSVREFRAMSRAQRVEELSGLQRARARLDAEQARLLSVMQIDAAPNADGREAFDKQWAREEVALVLRIASQSAAG